jgi:hypothetical protein
MKLIIFTGERISRNWTRGQWALYWLVVIVLISALVMGMQW